MSSEVTRGEQPSYLQLAAGGIEFRNVTHGETRSRTSRYSSIRLLCPRRFFRKTRGRVVVPPDRDLLVPRDECP